MDTGSNAPGTRPVNFVFCSGDAQPLKLDGTDRRFWIVDAAKAVPVAALEAAGGDLDKAVQAHTDWLPRQLAAEGDEVLTRAYGPANAPARFFGEWLDGALRLPVHTCTAEQLYRAFRHWCDKASIRWPVSQSTFTTAVRNARELPKVFYIVAKLEDPASGHVRTARLFIPLVNEYGIGDRGRAEQVTAFEEALTRWIQGRP